MNKQNEKKDMRKSVLVRIKPDMLEKLSALAEREYRSLNGEIEYLVAQAVCGESGGAYGEEFFDGARAFIWDGDAREMIPLHETDPVRLSDLKKYEEEKKTVVDNTRAFLQGLPAQNVLLYGDRGTGKSSTVHALINEFYANGLRLIEVKKKDIMTLPHMMNAISFAGKKLKFIIFIDDLAFVEGQENYGELKAVLEGSALHLGNVLIYATTNRRHLIRENYSDRSNDIHENDARQEQMSLSDRFGIVVTYINPDKREFFEILKDVLADRGISLPDGELAAEAERFCLEKGGRSPRGVRQLADLIEVRLRLAAEQEETRA